jgi:Fe-S-cluster containining protein
MQVFPKMENILKNYGKLLSAVDQWFSGCLAHSPKEINCTHGCSDCCRGLFDITLLDAWYLRSGFELLDEETKGKVAEKAEKRLKSMRGLWPGLERPFILNVKPEEEWDELMPDDDETPCPLLSETGECLVYPFRPMTCRLHGIPLVDVSGEIFHEEHCSMNFTGLNPLSDKGLFWNFSTCFETEVALFRQFTFKLVNQHVNELDTFIPLAVLMDYRSFDWKEWWALEGGG